MNADEIQNIFFVECEESLEAAEAGLDAYQAGTQDDETINAIFRAVHSIKGGAGAFGYAALQAFTHSFETLLADVREGTVTMHAELVNELLIALDCLRDHVEAARSGGTPPDDAVILAKLDAAHEAAGKEPVEENATTEPAAEAPPPAADDNLDAMLDDLLASPEPAPAPEAEAPSPAAEDDLDALLNDLLASPEPEAQSETAPAADAGAAGSEAADGADGWLVHIRPHAGSMDNGSEPLLWLRELRKLGGQCVASDIAPVPPLDELDPVAGYLGWTFRMPAEVLRDKVSDIFDFVGQDCSLAYGDDEAIPPVRKSAKPVAEAAAPAAVPAPSAAPAPAAPVAKAVPPAEPAQAPTPAPAPTQASQSIRIDLAKLDKLIDGVGELVIAQAMLAQRFSNEGLAHMEELTMLDGLVRDIQEHAMAFRAQPISSVFSRVPRLLRELASSTGRHVKLEVRGEHTELDKTVIERLGEPLTHLIRNAVDHGIEDAADRKAAGKPAEGTLTLSAEQKAGRVVIRIADDGRGIAADKVRAKAIANGLITEDTQLTEEETNNLIFAPGFSTAEQVSSISGRGVGMDVVRQNVKDLGGRITIESTPGEGTAFVMALPLTLAISDGMVVQVGDQSLVVPLAHVVESLRPLPKDLKGMGSTRQMLNVRGQFIPVVPLGRLAGGPTVTTDPCRGVLVIVETERCGQAALLVDAITDQRQFVIKSLDSHYRAVESVAGATILGNGRVALIVDVDHLVQFAGSCPELSAAA